MVSPRTTCLATMESLRNEINSFLLLVTMPLINSFFDIVKLDFLTNPTNRLSSSFVASMTFSSTSSTLNWCAFIGLFDGTVPVWCSGSLDMYIWTCSVPTSLQFLPMRSLLTFSCFSAYDLLTFANSRNGSLQFMHTYEDI